MTQYIAAVKKHALEHYNEDGWDFVVEAMDQEDMVRLLTDGFFDGRQVNSEADAIARIGEVVKLWDDRRKDIEATAW